MVCCLKVLIVERIVYDGLLAGRLFGISDRENNVL
jgi:hypothetical protein